MDIDPAADIREIRILLPQLFHQSGGDRQKPSHTHTQLLNSTAVFIYMCCVLASVVKDTHASVMVSIRIPMKRFFTDLGSETICKCVNILKPARMTLKK